MMSRGRTGGRGGIFGEFLPEPSIVLADVFTQGYLCHAHRLDPMRAGVHLSCSLLCLWLPAEYVALTRRTVHHFKTNQLISTP